MVQLKRIRATMEHRWDEKRESKNKKKKNKKKKKDKDKEEGSEDGPGKS